MKYEKTITLKNGKICQLRNASSDDAAAVLEIFNRTHEETDFLLSYPDENSYTVEAEADFLQFKDESHRDAEILAVVDGKIVGTAGIDKIGDKYKVRHRAEFGISILKDYWGIGIGRALTESCVECAKAAGFSQVELEVVADNESAAALYRKAGFKEFGRNPKGFVSRISGYQEVIHMRLEKIGGAFS